MERHVDGIDGTIAEKDGTKILFRCCERQVAHDKAIGMTGRFCGRLLRQKCLDPFFERYREKSAFEDVCVEFVDSVECQSWR